MACGSGACAVAALALDSGLVDRDGVVGVDMPGGRLYVKHLSADEPALLSGPAAFVFPGRMTI
jgi:diaminopimelate epimerase